MPIVDLPLEELYAYTGRSPKPADFDAYWARALAELDAASLDCELIPAPFQTPDVECYDLYFIGVGGARVHAKLCKPARIDRPAPAVCQFHGYSGSSGDWCDKLSYPAAGFVLAALDARGQAGASEDNGQVKGNTLHGHIIRGLADPDPDKLYFRNVFLDCAQLARIVMRLPYVDADRVGAFGGSQGGALTVACMTLEPRIRRAAPQYPFLSDYKRVWEMDLDINAYAELKEYLRNFDPRHEHVEEMWNKLGYIDLQNLAPRCRADVLLFTGLMDPVCPPSTQFAIYNKLNCKKDVVLYPDFGHEWLPGCSDLTMQFFLSM